jgi:hypothetical protein
MRTLLVLAGIALAGCEEKKPAAAPPPAPAADPAPAAPPPAAAAAPAAAAPKCPAGMQANATPAYCIKLPDSYKAKPVDAKGPKMGTVEYITESGRDSLEVFYSDATVDVFASNTEAELKMGKWKQTGKGDLPNGGKWYEGKDDMHTHIVGLYKSPVGTLKCALGFMTKEPPAKEVLDACKGLVVP